MCMDSGRANIIIIQRNCSLIEENDVAATAVTDRQTDRQTDTKQVL